MPIWGRSVYHKESSWPGAACLISQAAADYAPSCRCLFYELDVGLPQWGGRPSGMHTLAEGKLRRAVARSAKNSSRALGLSRKREWCASLRSATFHRLCTRGPCPM